MPLPRLANALRRVRLFSGQLRPHSTTAASSPPSSPSPPDLDAILKEKSAWDTFPDDVQKLAVFAEHARAGNYQIPLLSKANPSLDTRKAYQVAAAIRHLRETSNGDSIVGRKIGLTNRANWAAAGADRPFWSYMYRSSVLDLPPRDSFSRSQELAADLRHINALQPRVEPEIVFGLAKPVRAAMSDLEILNSIAWIAHGYEIVGSIFPDWQSTPTDSTAAFGMHQLLLAGPRTPLQTFYDTTNATSTPETLLQHLAAFTCELQRNGAPAHRGSGADVLDSPINALRSLARLLEDDPFNPPLAAGEIISTGTLTAAPEIKHNDIFTTTLDGLALPGLEVRFRLE